MASATTPTASAATRQRSGGDSTSRVELVPNDRARVSSSHEPERPAHALCFEAEGHARSGHRLPSCGESASAICETMPREHPPRRRDDDDTDQGGRLAAPTPGNCAAQESLLQSCDASQLESVASWKNTVAISLGDWWTWCLPLWCFAGLSRMELCSVGCCRDASRVWPC